MDGQRPTTPSETTKAFTYNGEIPENMLQLVGLSSQHIVQAQTWMDRSDQFQEEIRDFWRRWDLLRAGIRGTLNRMEQSRQSYMDQPVSTNPVATRMTSTVPAKRDAEQMDSGDVGSSSSSQEVQSYQETMERPAKRARVDSAQHEDLRRMAADAMLLLASGQTLAASEQPQPTTTPMIEAAPEDSVFRVPEPTQGHSAPSANTAGNAVHNHLANIAPHGGNIPPAPVIMPTSSMQASHRKSRKPLPTGRPQSPASPAPVAKRRGAGRVNLANPNSAQVTRKTASTIAGSSRQAVSQAGSPSTQSQSSKANATMAQESSDETDSRTVSPASFTVSPDSRTVSPAPAQAQEDEEPDMEPKEETTPPAQNENMKEEESSPQAEITTAVTATPVPVPVPATTPPAQPQPPVSTPTQPYNYTGGRLPDHVINATIPAAPPVPTKANAKTQAAYKKSIDIHTKGQGGYRKAQPCLGCAKMPDKAINCIVNDSIGDALVCAHCAKKKEKCSYQLFAEGEWIAEHGVRKADVEICRRCADTLTERHNAGDTEYRHECFVAPEAKKKGLGKACSACMLLGKRESCSLNEDGKKRGDKFRDMA